MSCGEDIEARPGTFFFSQRYAKSSAAEITKRKRIPVEELPGELRFSNLNPRLAAYLSQKEANLSAEDAEKVGDINLVVNQLRHQLDSTLTNDEDSQRFLMNEAIIQAPSILAQLSKLLSAIRAPIKVPKGLEYQLESGYDELTVVIHFVKREWQLTENREKWAKDHPNFTPTQGIKIDLETETDNPATTSKTTPKSTPRDYKPSKPQTLADIAESSSLSSTKSPRTNNSTSKRHLGPPTAGRRVKQRSDSVRSATSKTNMSIDQLSMNYGYRIPTMTFSLANKHECAENGWILEVNSEPGEEEKCKALRWATEKLALAGRQHEEKRKLEIIKKGLFDPGVRYFEEPSAKPKTNEYLTENIKKALKLPFSEILLFSLIPRMPAAPFSSSKSMFSTTSTGGTSISYYPSGRVAVLCSEADIGYYIIAYDDQAVNRMLAVFTPCGNGTVYHENGVAQFNCSSRGYKLSNSNGTIIKSCKWPSHRLPDPVVINLNRHLTFKTVAKSSSYLLFTAGRNSLKFPVSPADGACCPTKDQLGKLQSRIQYTSLTAKDLSETKNVKRRKKLDDSLNVKKRTEIDETLREPLPGDEYFDESERTLIKLQRKCRLIVEDWLDHYRLAVGLKSVELRKVQSWQRPHTSASMKSSPGGVRVVIESSATALPEVEEKTSRATSAPADPSKATPRSPIQFRREVSTNYLPGRRAASSSPVRVVQRPKSEARVLSPGFWMTLPKDDWCVVML